MSGRDWLAAQGGVDALANIGAAVAAFAAGPLLAASDFATLSLVAMVVLVPLAWLTVAGAAAGGAYVVWRRSQPVEDPWAEEYWADSTSDTASTPSTVDNLKAKAADAAELAQVKAAEVKDKAAEVAGQAKEKTAEVADQAKAKVAEKKDDEEAPFPSEPEI